MRSSIVLICLALVSIPSMSFATDVAISGPATIINGEVFWGPYVDVLFPVDDKLSFGIETGFQFWAKTVGPVSVSQWVLPILPTVIYSFKSENSAFTPFLGASMGVAIVNTQGQYKSASASDSGAAFQGLAHLGARIGEGQNFFIDMRLGGIAGEFGFAPTVGMYF